MKLHWTRSFGRTIVAMCVAALGPIAVAQPAQDVSASRSVYTSGSATDSDTGIGNQDSDETTSSQATGLFDESALVNVNDPNAVTEVVGFTSQVSDINFVDPYQVDITGELELGNEFLALGDGSIQADVVVYSETSLSFQMTTDQPVNYDINVEYNIEFEGSTGGPSDAILSLNAFDVSDSASGGEDTWNFSGQASPGEHDVNLALIHTATDVQPHNDIFAGGTVCFEITAQIIPTPASGLTLAMLVGLLVRRPQGRGMA